MNNHTELNLWISKTAGVHRNYDLKNAQYDLLYRMYYTLTPEQRKQINSDLTKENNNA